MLWHYTVGDNFRSILNDRLILPATTGIPNGERPIVWFTTDPCWEHTVRKGLEQPDGTVRTLGMKGLIAQRVMLIRVGVENHIAPHDWRDLKVLSGMGTNIARGLEHTARKQGANPSSWRGTFAPVPSEEWSTVEYFNGSEWVTFDAVLEKLTSNR